MTPLDLIDTVIRGEDGTVVREVSLTPIPVDRPPFPLAANVNVPVYFTAQPGGACLLIENPCCNIPYGLPCVYPGGCTKDQDCATDFTKHCSIDDASGSAVCQSGGTGCPG